MKIADDQQFETACALKNDSAERPLEMALTSDVKELVGKSIELLEKPKAFLDFFLDHQKKRSITDPTILTTTPKQRIGGRHDLF
jgi:hypothetical protein